jgi:hypothetical protein
MGTATMKLWSSDEEFFDLVRRVLFTAVVGDVMDKRGWSTNFSRRRSNQSDLVWW